MLYCALNLKVGHMFYLPVIFCRWSCAIPMKRDSSFYDPNNPMLVLTGFSALLCLCQWLTLDRHNDVIKWGTLRGTNSKIIKTQAYRGKYQQVWVSVNILLHASFLDASAVSQFYCRNCQDYVLCFQFGHKISWELQKVVYFACNCWIKLKISGTRSLS